MTEQNELTKAVEQVLEFMQQMKMSHNEATVVAQYVYETLKYNSLKDNIKEDIKQEILAELETLKQ